MTLTTPQLRLFDFLLKLFISVRTKELQELETIFANTEQDEAQWARRESLSGCMTEKERNSVWEGCNNRLAHLDQYLWAQQYGLSSLKSFQRYLQGNIWGTKK